jgi:hypothetical protein
MRLNRILPDQLSMGVISAINDICNGPNRTELIRVDESIKDLSDFYLVSCRVKRNKDGRELLIS